MKSLLKSDASNPARWMTSRYIFALVAIAILAVCAFGTVRILISEHKNTLAIVNISGRQRMLSQRTAFFVERLAKSHLASDRQQFRTKLKESTTDLEQAHLALTGQNNATHMRFSLSEGAQKLYFSGPYPLNAQMRGYIKVLNSILDMPDSEIGQEHPSIQYVLNIAPGQLVESLDRMVQFYQEEGEGAFHFLERLEDIFLSLTLSILMMEAFFIFRPMVRHVTKQMDHIQRVSHDIEVAKNNLEDTVSARTKELEVARLSAEQANQAKSKFLSAAGHDLKQPLEAIGMFSGMLERRMPDEKSAAIMRDMHDAQRSMRSLLDSILSLSKLEAGVVAPNPTLFELQPLLAQLTREYRVSAQSKGLAIRLVPTSISIYSDPLLLERIIRNLLSNAVRYTRRGRILLGCRHLNGAVRIEVWDTGSGIPEGGLDKIFTEFSQLEDPERDRSEGIGLGLAIVKRLTSLLGLKIICSSELGKGSRFGIEIPYHPITPKAGLEG
jgi:two-component system, sensor histidine kinase